jgi:hypothetical protein
MRNSFSKAVALVSVITLSVSGMALAAPLAPGKPAGVRAAQMGNTEWLVFGGLVAAGAIIAVASAGSGHDAVTAPPFTVVSTQ